MLIINMLTSKGEKSVLVYVHGDILGDALLKLPAIPLLKKGFPDHRIIWFSGCGASIFKTLLNPLIKEYVDEIVDDITPGKRWSDGNSRLPTCFIILPKQ